MGKVGGTLCFYLLDELDKIYTTCRFEKAWHVDRISPWCAAFSEDELKVSHSVCARISKTFKTYHCCLRH